MDVTTESHVELVKVVTWFMLFAAGAATTARLCIKWTMSHAFGWDDLGIVLAVAFDVGAGVAVSTAANNGLGQRHPSLTSEQLEAIQKGLYAAGIFFILTLTFARLSVVVLIWKVFATASHQAISLGLGVFITAQGTAIAFAAIFQCHLPRPWDFGSSWQCFDLRSFWLTVGILDIVTDVVLIAVPIMYVTTVHLPWAKKAIVAVCFAARLVDIAAIGTQLAYVKEFASPDLVTAVWRWFFVSQVVQTITIVTSNIPYVRYFLVVFPSGMFRPDQIRRRKMSYAEYIANRSNFWTRQESPSSVSRLRSIIKGYNMSIKTPSQLQALMRPWKGANPVTKDSTVGANGQRKSTIAVQVSRTIDVKSEPRLEQE